MSPAGLGPRGSQSGDHGPGTPGPEKQTHTSIKVRGPGTGTGGCVWAQRRECPRACAHTVLRGHGHRVRRLRRTQDGLLMSSLWSQRGLWGAGEGRWWPTLFRINALCVLAEAPTPARSPGAGSNHRASGMTVWGIDFYKMPSRTWMHQPHLPAGQGPARYSNSVGPGSPSSVLQQPCDLVMSFVFSEPYAQGIRCPFPGTHLLEVSTIPKPQSASLATS